MTELKVKAELTIGQLLRLKMDEKGIKQKELAAKLGTDESTFSYTLNKAGNFFVKKTVETFTAIGSEFEFMSANFKPIRVPENITTTNKLRNKMNGLTAKVDGEYYIILES